MPSRASKKVSKNALRSKMKKKLKSRVEKQHTKVQLWEGTQMVQLKKELVNWKTGHEEVTWNTA